MRELSAHEIDEVIGRTLAGNIAMVLAGGWAGTVAGLAVGTAVPGPGNIAGAGAGFALGSAVGIGYALATNDDRDTKDAGGS